MLMIIHSEPPLSDLATHMNKEQVVFEEERGRGGGKRERKRCFFAVCIESPGPEVL